MSKESDRNELGGRAANHLQSEKNNPRQAIRQRQRGVQIQRDKEAEKTPQKRHQRNNRREY